MTLNDQWDANCNCFGFLWLVDCAGEIGGYAIPGTPCDDGDATTGNDTWNTQCTCIGQVMDCAGVPGGTAFLDQCGTCVGGDTGLEANADVDDDGIIACEDNCSTAFNPTQADYDQDGVGDACDNCVWVSNSGQTDANGNGIGDACEAGVGLSEVDGLSGFAVYPNPSRGPVHIKTGDLAVERLQIYSATGELVRDLAYRTMVDLDAHAPGIYTMIALDAEGRPLARVRLIRQ
jgi:hypothetical protein